MKKLAWILAAIPAAAFAMGANCSGGAKSCTSDADCATEVDSPVCDTGSTDACIPAECDSGDAGDAECRVDDAGSSDACSSDDDCSDTDLCAQGSNGTGHCVTPEDPAVACDSIQEAPCNGDCVEVTADGVGGGDSVTFCDTTTAACEEPGRCTGVSG